MKYNPPHPTIQKKNENSPPDSCLNSRGRLPHYEPNIRGGLKPLARRDDVVKTRHGAVNVTHAGDDPIILP